MSIPNKIPNFQRGRRLIDGEDLNQLALLAGGISPVLTAKAGGGKATATPITGCITEVGTVATAADSVLLPLGYPGLQVLLVNSGANAMQVFGAGSDTINGAATGTGVSQASGTTAIYVCTSKASAVGKWYRLLSA